MIDIKSNLDRLEDSASNFYKRGQNDGASSALSSGDALQIASDLRGAIRDISNLRDYVWQLEKSANIAPQMEGIASALLAAVLPDLDRRIDEHVKTALKHTIQTDALEARIETLESFKDELEPDDISGLESYIDDRIDSAASNSDSDRDDETRDTVRDMIRDGDIVVTVDLA
jgi:hypothetical protein